MTNLDDEYTQLLRTLLPPGPAWDEEDPLINGLAPSLAQAHQHADSLMIEINPAQSLELINRYEKLCGLPDKCLANRAQTLEERQQVLDAKVNTVGGINAAFFKKQLEILGYPTATIEQFQHLDSTPDPTWGDKWRYYWRVNIPAEANVRWMSCTSSCNESIRTWGDSAVECVIERQCPSHTQVLFAYIKARVSHKLNLGTLIKHGYAQQ